jgi:hypothetical protein
MQAYFRKRLAEGGRGRGDAQIAGEREVAAGAEGGTVDRRNHRLRHLANGGDHAARGTKQTRKLLGVLAFDQFRHRGYVAAGAKSPSGASDHYHTNIPFGARNFDSFSQIAPHMSRERIQLLRTVECNRRDAGLFAYVDLFVGHKTVNGEW